MVDGNQYPRLTAKEDKMTAAIVYKTVNFPPGVVGVAYEAAIGYIDPAETITPASSAVSTGSLNNGLTVDTTSGVRITGTPTAAGTSTFTLTMTDTLGILVSSTYHITVVATGVSYTTAKFPDGFVGVPYESAVGYTNSNGVNTAASFAVGTGALPTGLACNADGTRLTGTPTTPGLFTFTLSMTDGVAGAAASGTYTIRIHTALVNDQDLSLAEQAAIRNGTPASLPAGAG
jgi:hypothetical protein